MKKTVMIAAMFGLVLGWAAAAQACSEHGTIAAGMVQDYLRGRFGNPLNRATNQYVEGEKIGNVSVSGTQSDSSGRTSERDRYETTVTLPDGNSVTFVTSWGATGMGSGSNIENWLNDKSKSLIDSYLAPPPTATPDPEEYRG